MQPAAKAFGLCDPPSDVALKRTGLLNQIKSRTKSMTEDQQYSVGLVGLLQFVNTGMGPIMRAPPPPQYPRGTPQLKQDILNQLYADAKAVVEAHIAEEEAQSDQEVPENERERRIVEEFAAKQSAFRHYARDTILQQMNQQGWQDASAMYQALPDYMKPDGQPAADAVNPRKDNARLAMDGTFFDAEVGNKSALVVDASKGPGRSTTYHTVAGLGALLPHELKQATTAQGRRAIGTAMDLPGKDLDAFEEQNLLFKDVVGQVHGNGHFQLVGFSQGGNKAAHAGVLNDVPTLAIDPLDRTASQLDKAHDRLQATDPDTTVQQRTLQRVVVVTTQGEKLQGGQSTRFSSTSHVSYPRAYVFDRDGVFRDPPRTDAAGNAIPRQLGIDPIIPQRKGRWSPFDFTGKLHGAAINTLATGRYPVHEVRADDPFKVHIKIRTAATGHEDYAGSVNKSDL
jgi:hypothetical protein